MPRVHGREPGWPLRQEGGSHSGVAYGGEKAGERLEGNEERQKEIGAA